MFRSTRDSLRLASTLRGPVAASTLLLLWACDTTEAGGGTGHAASGLGETAELCDFGQAVIDARAGAGGYVVPSGSVGVPLGASRPFAIMPQAGFRLVDVVVDGVSRGRLESYEFYDVQADHTLTASFAADAGERATEAR